MTWMRERGVRQDPWGNGDDHIEGSLENLSLKHKQTSRSVQAPSVQRNNSGQGDEFLCHYPISGSFKKSPKGMRAPNKACSIDKVTKKPSPEPRALLRDKGSGETSERLSNGRMLQVMLTG